MTPLNIAIFAVLLALAAGFAGELHAIGDSLAVFRREFAVIALALGIVAGMRSQRRLAAAGLVAGLAALTSLVPYQVSGRLAASAGSDDFVVYQKNLAYWTWDTADIVNDIKDITPDAVMLQELSPRNISMTEDLAPALPTQVVCQFTDRWGVAVLSRWPEIDGTAQCNDGSGVAMVQVDTPSGSVWLVSVHLHWPWPFAQRRQVTQILPVLSGIDGNAVLAGDFNMVPWSANMRWIGDATGTDLIGRAMTTFPASSPYFGISIDHVLGPGGHGMTTRRPGLNADHMGVVARVPLGQGSVQANPINAASNG